MSGCSQQVITVAAHQPGYLRGLYYFHKMAIADAFVSLDSVQFVRRELQNRQHMVAPDGLRFWLTLPVTKGREPICSKRIVDPGVLRRHWLSIDRIYRRTPNFAEWSPPFRALFEQDWARLVDFCDAYDTLVRSLLDITTPTFASSELLPSGRERKGELLASAAWKVAERVGRPTGLVYLACPAPMKPSHYLQSPREGFGGTESDYMATRGVTVETFAFRHPVYEQHQLRGPSFVPDLPAFDLVFNHGPRAGEVFRQAGLTSLQLGQNDRS